MSHREFPIWKERGRVCEREGWEGVRKGETERGVCQQAGIRF
jgi:hypothetical protein